MIVAPAIRDDRSLWSHSRMVLLCVGLAVWFGAVLFRLYWLQVERHEHFALKATEQQQRIVVLDPPRGTLLDARGRQLAVSAEALSIAAAPHLVRDKPATAEALASVLDLDQGELLADLESRRKFIWVERKVEPATADAVRELDLDGIDFLPESKRYYPLGSLAAQVLGYVGTDNSGLAGIEFQYDAEVASGKGRRTVTRDGRFGTVFHPSLEQSDARPGADLHLTIDAAIQAIAERELAAAVDKHNAKQGTLVMLDPASGAVLAMATYPTFDPNRFGDYPKDTWRNPPVMNSFEPGSTFKMVTLAAALEANVVDPLQTFFCGNGGIILSGRRINDHHPFADLTVREIIAKSSNVGAIKLGQAAGRERLYGAIEAFGFGRPTGVDLPSEASGSVRPLQRWSKLTPAYVSFGQGISLTALQLTNAFAAIANGGHLLRPYVVAAIGDDDKNPDKRQLTGLPISPSSVRQIRSMLESVVIEGTAKQAQLDGYRAGGKTGTAQKAFKGGYSPDKFIASFVGFAPIKHPALAMAVVIDEPWPRYHGGDAAAPVFAAVAQQTLLYLGIEPDKAWPQIDNEVTSKPPPRTQLASRSTSAPAVRLASAIEPTEQPDGTVPDFSGLSAREAISQSNRVGVRPALDGHGRVARQHPAPGTPLELAEDRVELWLTPEAL